MEGTRVLGERVRIVGTSKVGTVKGTANYHWTGGVVFYYVIELDTGFYSKDDDTFISRMLAHPDALLCEV